jgi:hypothetical protein
MADLITLSINVFAMVAELIRRIGAVYTMQKFVSVALHTARVSDARAVLGWVCSSACLCLGAWLFVRIIKRKRKIKKWKF